MHTEEDKADLSTGKVDKSEVPADGLAKDKSATNAKDGDENPEHNFGQSLIPQAPASGSNQSDIATGNDQCSSFANGDTSVCEDKQEDQPNTSVESSSAEKAAEQNNCSIV